MSEKSAVTTIIQAPQDRGSMTIIEKRTRRFHLRSVTGCLTRSKKKQTSPEPRAATG